MKALTTTTLALAAAMAIGGCAPKIVSQNVYKQEGCYIESEERSYTLPEGRINYQALTDEAIDTILDEGGGLFFGEAKKLPAKIIVTDFVDLTSLENNSKFGYVLSNSIKNSVSNKLDIAIVEAEVSKYFKLSGNGLKILSRDIGKLRTNNLNIRHALVGTYTATQSEVVVFVKLVNLQNGLIEGSYSKTLPMNCAMLQLLKEQ